MTSSEYSLSLSQSESEYIINSVDESKPKERFATMIIRFASKNMAQQINLLPSTELNVDAQCPWQMSCHIPWRLQPRWRWAAVICVCHDFKTTQETRDNKIESVLLSPCDMLFRSEQQKGQQVTIGSSQRSVVASIPHKS